MWAECAPLADGRLYAWSWDGSEEFTHEVGDLSCELVGAVGTSTAYIPVVRVYGHVYHNTASRERAERIFAEGFSLREQLHGRSHGDGVYTSHNRDGAAYGPSTISVYLDGAVLADGSDGDEYSRLSVAAGGPSALVRAFAEAGIQGLLCQWGAIVYDLEAAEPDLLVRGA